MNEYLNIHIMKNTAGYASFRYANKRKTTNTIIGIEVGNLCPRGAWTLTKATPTGISAREFTHYVSHADSDKYDSQSTLSMRVKSAFIARNIRVPGRGRRVVKYSYEAFLALIGLIVSAPLIVFIAFLIKIDSPGPVFFTQIRRGYRQKPFKIYKFRTMYTHSEGNGGAMTDGLRGQTVRDDVRVTRFGRFLRRTSLDELPQLYNVLCGNMALIGPRPHAFDSCVDSINFVEASSLYPARYIVLPGVTGLAQVQGHRGAVTSKAELAARIAADLTYIRQWSVGLDLRIMFQTVAIVAKGVNAH